MKKSNLWGLVALASTAMITAPPAFAAVTLGGAVTTSGAFALFLAIALVIALAAKLGFTTLFFKQRKDGPDMDITGGVSKDPEVTMARDAGTFTADEGDGGIEPSAMNGDPGGFMKRTALAMVMTVKTARIRLALIANAMIAAITPHRSAGCA